MLICSRAPISCRNAALVVAIAAFAGSYYVYKDPRHYRRRLLSRLWFLICKRDLAEAKLERELLKERKYPLSKTFHNADRLTSVFNIAEPDIIASHTQYVDLNGHRLRIVHIIHELGSRVPLLVFIHGLGGQVRWDCTCYMWFTHKHKGGTMAVPA